jgi:hypothetical protein
MSVGTVPSLFNLARVSAITELVLAGQGQHCKVLERG